MWHPEIDTFIQIWIVWGCHIKLLSYFGNYFDDPTQLTGSLRCACVYIAPRRLDYCTQEVVLSQVYICSSVKLGLCSPELDFSLFCDILDNDVT